MTSIIPSTMTAVLFTLGAKKGFDVSRAQVSLVIVAQNEERTIGRVIDAAGPICNEIILVDSGSTDKTKEIAADKGARVVHQDWLGYARQKNFAMDLAQFDWILSLDADEIFTPALQAELLELIESPQMAKFDGYKIPRVLYIGESAITHGGFYPDAQLRLIKKDAGRFGERLVHEAIKMEGPCRVLKNHMDHYSYKNIEEFAAAMDKYARLSAQEFFQRGNYAWRASALNMFINPCWTFLQRFFLRGGFLDGALGLRLAVIYSDYVRRKSYYLRQLIKEKEGAV